MDFNYMIEMDGLSIFYISSVAEVKILIECRGSSFEEELTGMSLRYKFFLSLVIAQASLLTAQSSQLLIRDIFISLLRDPMLTLLEHTN